MHSRGAAVWDRLLEVLDGTDVYMLNKGFDPDKEEYSLLQCQESTFTFRNIMSEYEITDVDFCGIVREICVMNTMKDFMKIYEDVNVRVLLDYTPTLDGGAEFYKFLEEHLEVLTVKSAI
jgi:nicotinamidase-related amidase